jgi:hypothetical protein
MFAILLPSLGLAGLLALGTAGEASPAEAPQETASVITACEPAPLPEAEIETLADPGLTVEADSLPAEGEFQGDPAELPEDATGAFGVFFADLAALGRDLIAMLEDLIAKGAEQEVAITLTPEQLALLESTLTPEEFDVWIDCQPRDEHGMPILTAEEVEQMQQEVQALADLLANDLLDSEQRERVEYTILARVAVLESFRFGSDRRESLLDLLRTIEPDGRRIDSQEAQMLVKVARGEELLDEIFPWIQTGLA